MTCRLAVLLAAVALTRSRYSILSPHFVLLVQKMPSEAIDNLSHVSRSDLTSNTDNDYPGLPVYQRSWTTNILIYISESCIPELFF